MNITEKLQSLIDAANATTSESASDITEAMQDLVDGYGGTPPSGKKLITTTEETDVASYATAQVSDDNLLPENIAKDVTVLGITGTHEGGITPTGTINITENGEYDVTDKASAVVDVEGEQLLKYATQLPYTVFNGATLPSKFKCEFVNLTTANEFLRGATGITEVDVVLPQDITLNGFAYGSNSIKNIKIRPTPYRPSFFGNFGGNAAENVDCEFDLSTCGVSSYAFRSHLKSIGIVPNSINTCASNPYDYSAEISDAVYVAVANGLNINAPSNYPVGNANIKNKMNAIMGDVNSDNLFVANPSGTISLTQFITNVKGWTIT